jgi:Mrp family chromosome partitioning ATPase/uncharacterized protein involved in exopolysaccharide biosynthesis
MVMPIPTLLRRRWRSFSLGLGTTTALLMVLYYLQPPLHQASGRLLLPPPPPGAKPTESVDFFEKTLRSLFFRENKYAVDRQLLTSDLFLQNTIQTLNLRTDAGIPASPRQLRSQVVVIPTPVDNELQVRVRHRDPKLALGIVDSLLQQYIQNGTPEPLATSLNVAPLIQPLLVQSETLLSQARRAIYLLQGGRGSQSPQSSPPSTSTPSLELATILASVQFQAPGIQQELATLQAQLKDSRNPAQQGLLETAIIMTQQRQVLLQSLTVLLGQPAGTANPAQIEAAEAQVIGLQQQVNVTKEAYERLLTDQTETWQSSGRAVGAAKITQAAVTSDRIFRPHFPWFMGAGLFLGTGVGLAAAGMRERFDRQIRSVADMQEALQMPILATVPALNLPGRFQANQEQLGLLNRGIGNIHETFDRLEASLTGLSGDRLPQVLGLTSAVNGEGKTSLCIHLALALVRAGCKVLIIDTQQKTPSQATYWQISARPGLTDFLHGEAVLKQVLHRVWPNLDVMSAGGPTDSFDLLLNSPGVAILMQTLRSRYQHILVDCPALSDSIHAYQFAQTLDAPILVTRWALLNTARIGQTRDILNRSPQIIWGMILNDSLGLTGAKLPLAQIQDSRWDASLRLYKRRSPSEFTLSTLATLGTALPKEANLQNLDNLYQMPLADFRQYVKTRWETWVDHLTGVMAEEEEVWIQRDIVQDLNQQIHQGNQYYRLDAQNVLEEEREKLRLLVDTIDGQRLTLSREQERLHQYLQVLYERLEAEL